MGQGDSARPAVEACSREDAVREVMLEVVVFIEEGLEDAGEVSVQLRSECSKGTWTDGWAVSKMTSGNFVLSSYSIESLQFSERCASGVSFESAGALPECGQGFQAPRVWPCRRRFYA
jgi:hypothetical protein